MPYQYQYQSLYCRSMIISVGGLYIHTAPNPSAPRWMSIAYLRSEPSLPPPIYNSTVQYLITVAGTLYCAANCSIPRRLVGIACFLLRRAHTLLYEVHTTHHTHARKTSPTLAILHHPAKIFRDLNLQARRGGGRKGTSGLRA